MEAEIIGERYLMYFVVPVWLCAGLADWYCHKRSHISQHGGLRESLLHLLMLLEMGVPVLAALFFEVNALVLAVMIFAFLAHEATALWDVTYAVHRRRVTPIEQHVHSFLEMVPLMALSVLALIHWGQFQALFRAGDEIADFSLRLKQVPLPASYIGAVLFAIVLLEALPYLQELTSGICARRHTHKKSTSTKNK
ncbi:diguanylate cyclase [Herbaspirillum sp. WGmk3]|uniref:diguanylate cyclase n=1 Tax=Herbaspirillum sp. WGmk3 TaxID=2919925 RepID=UPI0020911988|nr:diguanylate cyclase [Herbaspirillum sp. WGmk3]MCO4857256.1 diguanylate cyclase [Herbaspirillum sp. WGmk3]